MFFLWLKLKMEILLTIFKLTLSWFNILLVKIFAHVYRSQDRSFYLPPVEHDFLEYSATKLAEKIRNKELTSEQVVKAFIERVKKVNGELNAVVDERYELAIKEAQGVDDYLKNENVSIEELKRSKPFLGVPFSTKESTSCEGLNYTLGLKARTGVKGTEDAEVIKLTKEAGAILLGVTNIPELNLWCESRNTVYGQTCNPYNKSRTVGGSSGGEGSIIAASGSPFGVGTDIGGSIRIPAFFCGVFGHKPTTGLTPMKGTTKRTGLEVNTMVVAGPMSRHAEDLLPLLKILVKDKISMLSLDTVVDIKKINYFYMEESFDRRTNPVSAEMQKVLRKASIHCQATSGRPTKKLKLEGFSYSYKLWRYWMTKEPFKFTYELGNESEVNAIVEIGKKLVFQSDHTIAAILKLIDCYLPQEKAAWAEAETEKLRHELLDYLGDNGVLLFPSHTYTAPYHYSSLFRPYNFAYLAIFNVLKVPVTQVPCGVDSQGLPLGIQVVAAPYKDHLCLAVAKELEKVLGGWVPPYHKVRA